MKFVYHGLLYDINTATLIGDSGWINDSLSDFWNATQRSRYYQTSNGAYFRVMESKHPGSLWLLQTDYKHVGCRVMTKEEAIDFMHGDGIDVTGLVQVA